MMGMWTTDSQDTMKIVLRAFGDASHRNYGSHSFAAGYLESLVVQMMPFMPKRVQKSFVEDLVRATKRQEQEVVNKLSKETV
jgi:hypothetical protein